MRVALIWPLVNAHSMIDLDDLTAYEELDPSGLRRRLSTLPEQCSQAWLEAKNTVVPDNLDRCTEVIVAGMGGSAIAGNLVADLAGSDSGTPVRVVRDFRIPGRSVDFCATKVQCVRK